MAVAAAKGCAVGYKAKEDMRFGREDYFVVYGRFEDALGSKTEDSPELEVSGAAEDALDKSATSATGYSARASAGSVLVMVEEGCGVWATTRYHRSPTVNPATMK